MNLHISINGKDIEAFHLTALKGTLDVLMKPCKYKALVTNENAAMNGVNVVSTPSSRMVAKNEMTIPFLLRSTSLSQLNEQLQSLQQTLLSGKNSSGINELYCAELHTRYYLVFQEISAYSTFGLDGVARISIKFIEPNPNNRV